MLEQALAVAKLALVGAATPVLVPGVTMLAASATLRTTRRTAVHADAVASLLEGAPAADPFSVVGRLPVAARLVVTSDLHRCVPGRTDWPGRQGTDRLYEALLDVYGQEAWHLVEAGDVEDFWMVGGSRWGAVYDVARLGGALLPRSWRPAVRARLYGEHLRRIVAHNDGIYDRIDRGFHLHGRYHRLVGNHDDVYRHHEVAEQLRLHHPGLALLDALVVGDPGQPQAFVAHGHHTDAWNAPDLAFLGRLGTWMGCTLADLPLLGFEAGLPDERWRTRLLRGAHPDVLTVVSRWFGANRELYSMDEVQLFESFRRRWPELTEEGGGDPVLVLGHTHLPLVAPGVPSSNERWWRYLNVGSGVVPRMVTAVEWDGPATLASGTAQARLVAWVYADDLPDDVDAVVEVVGEDRVGRAVARLELSRADDDRLAPRRSARR